MLSSYLSVFTWKTIYSLIIATVVPYLFFKFGWSYNVDLTLISIAIIFPLVFAIRVAFRRREKAMEYLGQYRSSLTSVLYCFESNKKLTLDNKLEIKQKIVDVSDTLVECLSVNFDTHKKLDETIKKVYDFPLAFPDSFSSGQYQKIYTLLQKANNGIENVMSIHSHRTPILLKAYCKLFIYIFPVIYTPSIIYKLGLENDRWISYFIIIISEFILISLFNIQNQIEYPFDREDLDDIKVLNYRINRADY